MSRKLNIIVEKSQVTELPTVTHSPVCAFSPKPNSIHLIVTMTASASAATASKLARVLRATAAKVSEERRILEEYRGQLEMVGPAPGQPGDQHEAMVSGGRLTGGMIPGVQDLMRD